MERFVLITGKERKALEFKAIGGGKNAYFPWEWAVEKTTLLDKSIFFVKDYSAKNVCA